ncbi:hypothetical protein DFS34DRAFT_635585 [Phlyctochytrium arcticum]|nr:hypothetical protein DFS34DRAFT_635585 [Phlyctochytrium arcticum]
MDAHGVEQKRLEKLASQFVKSPKKTDAQGSLSTIGGDPHEIWRLFLTAVQRSILAALASDSKQDQERALEAITTVIKIRNDQSKDDNEVAALINLAFRKVVFLELRDGEPHSSTKNDMDLYASWLSALETTVMPYFQSIPDIRQAGRQATAAFLMLNYLMRFTSLPIANDAKSKKLATVELRLLQTLVQQDSSLILFPMSVIGAHVSGLFFQAKPSKDNCVPLEGVQQFLELFFGVPKLPVLSGDVHWILDTKSVEHWRQALLSNTLEDVQLESQLKIALLARDVLFTDLIFTPDSGLLLKKAPGWNFEKTSGGMGHDVSIHNEWFAFLASRAMVNVQQTAKPNLAAGLVAHSAILHDTFIPYLRPACCVAEDDMSRMNILLALDAISPVAHDFVIKEFCHISQCPGQQSEQIAQTVTKYLGIAQRKWTKFELWSSCSNNTWQELRKQHATHSVSTFPSPLVLLYTFTSEFEVEKDTSSPYAVPWQIPFLNGLTADYIADLFIKLACEKHGTTLCLRMLEKLEMIATSFPATSVIPEVMEDLFCGKRGRASEHTTNTHGQEMRSKARTVLAYLMEENSEHLRLVHQCWHQVSRGSAAASEMPGSTVGEKRKRDASVSDSGSLPHVDKAPRTATLKEPNPFAVSGITESLPVETLAFKSVLARIHGEWSLLFMTLPSTVVEAHLFDLIRKSYPTPKRIMLDYALPRMMLAHPVYTGCITSALLRQPKQKRPGGLKDRCIGPFLVLVELFQKPSEGCSLDQHENTIILVLQAMLRCVGRFTNDTKCWAAIRFEQCLGRASRVVQGRMLEYIMTIVDQQLGLSNSDLSDPLQSMDDMPMGKNPLLVVSHIVTASVEDKYVPPLEPFIKDASVGHDSVLSPRIVANKLMDVVIWNVWSRAAPTPTIHQILQRTLLLPTADSRNETYVKMIMKLFLKWRAHESVVCVETTWFDPLIQSVVESKAENVGHVVLSELLSKPEWCTWLFLAPVTSIVSAADKEAHGLHLFVEKVATYDPNEGIGSLLQLWQTAWNRAPLTWTEGILAHLRSNMTHLEKFTAHLVVQQSEHQLNQPDTDSMLARIFTSMGRIPSKVAIAFQLALFNALSQSATSLTTAVLDALCNVFDQGYAYLLAHKDHPRHQTGTADPAASQIVSSLNVTEHCLNRIMTALVRFLKSEDEARIDQVLTYLTHSGMFLEALIGLLSILITAERAAALCAVMYHLVCKRRRNNDDDDQLPAFHGARWKNASRALRDALLITPQQLQQERTQQQLQERNQQQHNNTPADVSTITCPSMATDIQSLLTDLARCIPESSGYHQSITDRFLKDTERLVLAHHRGGGTPQMTAPLRVVVSVLDGTSMAMGETGANQVFESCLKILVTAMSAEHTVPQTLLDPLWELCAKRLGCIIKSAVIPTQPSPLIISVLQSSLFYYSNLPLTPDAINFLGDAYTLFISSPSIPFPTQEWHLSFIRLLVHGTGSPDVRVARTCERVLLEKTTTDSKDVVDRRRILLHVTREAEMDAGDLRLRAAFAVLAEMLSARLP